MSEGTLAAANDANLSGLSHASNTPDLSRSKTAEDRWKGKLYRPASVALEKIGRASQIIRLWLASSGVSFVLAERGSGKTLVMLDQALSLATNQDWMGFPTERDRFAVYCVGEDLQGAGAHIEAWYKKHGVGLSDCGVRFLIVSRVPDLLDEDDCRSLVQHVRACLPLGAKPVVFIDTWQRATANGKQNDDGCMQRAINNAEFIGRELGGPVIFASHPPKGNNSTILGSSIVENSSMGIWKLTASGCDLSLKVIRAKSIGDGTELHLTIEQVTLDGEDDFHLPRSGAVVVQQSHSSVMSAGHAPFKSSKPVTTREIALLTAMNDHPGLSYSEACRSGSLGRRFQAHGRPG